MLFLSWNKRKKEQERKREKQGIKRKQKRKTRRKKKEKNKRETEKDQLKKGEANKGPGETKGDTPKNKKCPLLGEKTVFFSIRSKERKGKKEILWQLGKRVRTKKHYKNRGFSKALKKNRYASRNGHFWTKTKSRDSNYHCCFAFFFLFQQQKHQN